MANEKRRTFDGKFKERAVALAKERKNVAQAARELEISRSLLRTWIAAAETAEAKGKGLRWRLGGEARDGAASKAALPSRPRSSKS